ncbi:hypothetical protein AGDE_13055 [Angomonas deanei]|uniref:Uncharacterized protein n=1 Tax=Angomonas deanei TaxID=59799 RepID=A0A7G2C9R4_9TRYP|nr:hypothetical protein AGDE_13055 [Angomonas deanei]CAD2215734.1 hypothetical protein, conserved [Angomonas deanei]|eukprot:EPY23097.1 hypothetical protein AGDE_13055 [Angomonas deanei]
MTEVVHEFRKFGFSIVIRVNHLPSVAASQKNIKGEYERKRNAKMRMERVQRPPPDTAPTVIHHGEEGLCLDLYIRVELRSPGISLDILKGFFSTAVYKVEWCFPIVVSADPAATDPRQVQDVASFLVDTFAVNMNARDSQGGLFFNYKDDMELVFSSALYEAHR